MPGTVFGMHLSFVVHVNFDINDIYFVRKGILINNEITYTVFVIVDYFYCSLSAKLQVPKTFQS